MIEILIFIDVPTSRKCYLNSSKTSLHSLCLESITADCFIFIYNIYIYSYIDIHIYLRSV